MYVLYKLAVMPTRALFAGSIAIVEAKEQVMCGCIYGHRIDYLSFFNNITFFNTKPALSLPQRAFNLWFIFNVNTHPSWIIGNNCIHANHTKRVCRKLNIKKIDRRTISKLTTLGIIFDFGATFFSARWLFKLRQQKEGICGGI